MQNIFTNIKCSEIILYNTNENWYIILYDLFSRLCYIATCGPFCKDATHMNIFLKANKIIIIITIIIIMLQCRTINCKIFEKITIRPRSCK